ncbi:MAG: hypothetical protein Q4A17_14815 [Thermoguttaceae bacterium]|nr:hypothetical protein [Thermoguttaceae bacterium]
MINRLMKDENGVLTFEWILLITLLVIGIIGGVAAIRDALIIECAETAGAIVALNQSYSVSGPFTITVDAVKVTDEGATVEIEDGTFVETTGTKSEFLDVAGKVKVEAADTNSTTGDSTNTDPDNPTPTPNP